MPFTAAMTGFQRSLLLGPRLSPGSLNMNGVDPEPTTSGSVVASAQPAPQGVQLALHERVERVQPVGPVERHPGDAVAFVIDERLEVGVHARRLSAPLYA